MDFEEGLGVVPRQHPQVARDPLRGQLFENLAVAELVKTRTNAGRDPGLFFLRDSKGFEIDALFAAGGRLRPIEIKSARSFDASFVGRLLAFRERVPDAAPPLLVYDGDDYPSRAGVRCINVRTVSRAAIFDA